MGWAYDAGAEGPEGPTGPSGIDGITGPTGATGAFQPSFLFAWKSDEQSPAPLGEEGSAVAFTAFEVIGTALSSTSPTNINVLESGYYYISWDIYKTGYDSAFALYYNAAMLAGSNYGAMAHDEKYHGQTVSHLTAGGVLTLNRIDSLYTQTILNEIGDRTLVTGASIVIMKIG